MRNVCWGWRDLIRLPTRGSNRFRWRRLVAEVDIIKADRHRLTSEQRSSSEGEERTKERIGRDGKTRTVEVRNSGYWVRFYIPGSTPLVG